MFVSTRGGAVPQDAPSVILTGLAPDGGLYVPEELPKIPLEEIESMGGAGYTAWARRVLGALLPAFSEAALGQAIDTAYASFCDPAVAPLTPLETGTYLLELYHGPTLAFKDIALTLLPHLAVLSKQALREARELLVLVATSGDTGKAALEGFRDVQGTRCVVFYPDEGVSPAQRLQMLTQRGENTHVFAVAGNFDDCQSGVKRLFQDQALAKRLQGLGRRLCSANSINYGRLAPQVVYYFYAYAQLLARGAVQAGQPVHFAVPTGNFGNILAADYARRMGLPVGRLLCASNRNHVLADFLTSGEYNTQRDFHTTLSPSMDILISSNLERLLFELCGRDAAQVRTWMLSLGETGRYHIGPQAMSKLSQVFRGDWADDAQTARQIRKIYQRTGRVLDPHTAVASTVLDAYRTETFDTTPCVLVATASPFKFGKDVLAALGEETYGLDDFAACERLAALTGVQVPSAIAGLPNLPVRFGQRILAGQMEEALLSILG